MSHREPPASLCTPGLASLWSLARARLDRFGIDRRGTVPRPDLEGSDLLAVQSLLGRRPPKHIDLAELESALVDRAMGTDLDSALDALGAPASARHAERRAASAERSAMVDAVRRSVEMWPEAWAVDYGDELLSTGRMAGLDSAEAAGLLDSARRLLDALATVAVVGGENLGSQDSTGFVRQIRTRTDIAATLFGSSHALDDGTRLERCARLALRRSFDLGEHVEGRDVWEASGLPTDLVSAPALTWNLPLEARSTLGAMVRAATAASVPVHLSQMALRRWPISVSSVAPVLVVENPRLVEAAIERQLPWPVIATNGNPSSAVTFLVDALVAAGVECRYHGDFDSAGIAICRRMAERGCTPWRMDDRHYEIAVAAARREGVELPVDERGCGSTPWSPELAKAFDSERCIVHEERLLDQLLDSSNW